MTVSSCTHLLYLFTAAAGRPSVFGDKTWTRWMIVCLSSGVRKSCSETSAAVSFKTLDDRVWSVSITNTDNYRKFKKNIWAEHSGWCMYLLPLWLGFGSHNMHLSDYNFATVTCEKCAFSLTLKQQNFLHFFDQSVWQCKPLSKT